MTASWVPTAARAVEVGATVRLADGRELEVSRIEHDFLGMPRMLAFIEDSPRQWFKAPAAVDAMIDVRARA